jgi:hypothetical protein
MGLAFVFAVLITARAQGQRHRRRPILVRRLLDDLWIERGVNSAPVVIINDRYLISVAQPAEVFEQALRTIAAQA